jgi:predicted metal-dependent hydrolase
MVTELRLGEIAVDVVLKDIKNVHLGVYPPTGRVRISAPKRMSLNTIRVFAISKLGWIKQQQRKLRSQERETPREYLDRESHYVWGIRYLLKVVLDNDSPKVELKHRKMILRVAPGTSEETKQASLARWYREQIKTAVPALVTKWGPIIPVKVERVFVQRMKTKWGSCNAGRRSIRLNTDLAKKPRECLEYIVVHEMIHILEPTHGPRFVALMDRLMPQWRACREQLNRLPVCHEKWTY